MAGRLLPSTLKGMDAVDQEVRTIIDELKAAMFLVGASDVGELAASHALIVGQSRDWLDHVME